MTKLRAEVQRLREWADEARRLRAQVEALELELEESRSQASAGTAAALQALRIDHDKAQVELTSLHGELQAARARIDELEGIDAEDEVTAEMRQTFGGPEALQAALDAATHDLEAAQTRIRQLESGTELTTEHDLVEALAAARQRVEELERDARRDRRAWYRERTELQAGANALRDRVASLEAARPEGPPRNLLSEPRDGLPDDLTRIRGVGPVTQKLLNEAGLYHYDQLAGLDDEDLDWLATTYGVSAERIVREAWRAQAARLFETSSRDQERDSR